MTDTSGDNASIAAFDHNQPADRNTSPSRRLRSGLGLLLFGIAVAFSLLNSLSLASIVPLIAGAVVNVVSGIVFVLYGKTSSQLSAFHSRLDVLQRYLLANSICEGLSEAERDKARSALIGEISRGQSLT